MSKINLKQLQNLSQLPLLEEKKLSENTLSALKSTIEYVSKIGSVHVEDTPETHQVTQLSNVFRPDEINSKTKLSQKQALQNTKRTYQGYIVVDQLIET